MSLTTIISSFAVITCNVRLYTSSCPKFQNQIFKSDIRNIEPSQWEDLAALCPEWRGKMQDHEFEEQRKRDLDHPPSAIKYN